MKNTREDSWVLVYDTVTKKVVTINEPNLFTECGGDLTLVEFDTKELLNQYMVDNELIINEPMNDEITL